MPAMSAIMMIICITRKQLVVISLFFIMIPPCIQQFILYYFKFLYYLCKNQKACVVITQRKLFSYDKKSIGVFYEIFFSWYT